MLKNLNATDVWTISWSLYDDDIVLIGASLNKVSRVIEENGQKVFYLIDRRGTKELPFAYSIEDLFDTREQAYTAAVKKATTKHGVEV